MFKIRMALPANPSWISVSLFFLCCRQTSLVQEKLKPRALVLARHFVAMSGVSIKVLTPVTTLPCLCLTGRMVICMLMLPTTAPNQTAGEWFNGPSLGLALQLTGSSWALLSTVFLGNSSRRWDKTLPKSPEVLCWCLWTLGSRFTFSSCSRIALMNRFCVLSSFRLLEEYVHFY